MSTISIALLTAKVLWCVIAAVIIGYNAYRLWTD